MQRLGGQARDSRDKSECDSAVCSSLHGTHQHRVAILSLSIFNMNSPVIFAAALTIFAGALPLWAPPWWRGRLPPKLPLDRYYDILYILYSILFYMIFYIFIWHVKATSLSLQIQDRKCEPTHFHWATSTRHKAMLAVVDSEKPKREVMSFQMTKRLSLCSSEDAVSLARVFSITQCTRVWSATVAGCL